MDQKQLSAAILKFSAKVLKELEKDKSTVSSPLSAEFILALLTLADSAGARSELLTALGFTDEDTVRKSFSDLITKLQTVKGITLEVANKIYIKKDLKLHREVEKDATEIFRTETENINFTDPSAAKIINNWAESKTNNKIKDVISQSTLNADTEMILVNAIYFQGSWNAPFDKDRTTNAPFYVDANTTIMVPMMTHKRADDFQYSYGGLGQLIVLPYLGRESSMVILLPNDINGVDEVLQKLAEGYDLVSEIDSLSKTKVEVKIPKFKIETEINLGQVLPKLGIKSIFNPGLDKMLEEKRQLRVSQAVQKAFIEVNEVGTEAAAVTVMKLMKRKGPRQFTANRPFVYFLLAVDGTTLFTGVYRGDGSAPCDATSYSAGGGGDGYPDIISVEDIYYVQHSVALSANIVASDRTVPILDNARLVIQKFSSKVLKHLLEDGNVVSLPVSAEFLMALADVAAKGPAREELLQALGFPDVDCLRTTFSQIKEKTTLDPKIKLEVASKAFLANGLQLSPEIETDAKENVESIDFGNSAVAAGNINAWAKEKTHGKIENIISAADIDGSKKLILLNAIYFYGEWWYPFNEKDTKDHPFYLNQYTAISIPMMFHNITNFPYGTNSFSKILKLPYSGESGLVIVLPNTSFGLKGTINQLAEGYDILSDISSLEYHRVEAAIPRFKIESEIDLKPILHKLGIDAIFETGVDLVKDNAVAVSDIRQKSFIEIKEKGTEAAAATCERYEKSAARPPPAAVFMADRPFVYILLGPGNLPLFIGVYRGPAGEGQAQKSL